MRQNWSEASAQPGTAARISRASASMRACRSAGGSPAKTVFSFLAPVS